MYFLHSVAKKESRRSRIKQVLRISKVSCYTDVHGYIHNMPMVRIHLRSGRDGWCRCRAGDLRKIGSEGDMDGLEQYKTSKQ